MSQELVISSNPIETTVAILEDDRLVEICVERHAKKAIAGSIYKGRVTRVLPGMQSAFVDLGLKRDAFLYVTDIADPADLVGGDSDLGVMQAEPVQPPPAATRKSAAKAPKKEGAADSAPKATQQRPRKAVESDRRARRRWRRRRRRRRRSRSRRTGRQADTAEAAPKPRAKGTPAQTRDRDPTQAPVELLPGESIAKYRRADRSKPAGSKPAEGSKAAAGTKQEAGATSVPDAASADPPRSQAEVAAPPVVAELRLGVMKWLKRKAVTAEAPAPEQPASAPKPPQAAKTQSQADRARKKRPRRAARRPPRRRKRRSGRRPASPKPAPSGRVKARPKSSESKPAKRHRGSKQQAPHGKIKDLLKKGQKLIVQVNKEPVGSKGARITSHITLPGRYMVYMVTAKHNGVARRIQPESERNRLRKFLKKHSRSKPGGFVVRTAGQGVDEKELTADMDFLYGLWKSIQEKSEKCKAPAKLHSDLDIVERVMRDHLGQDYKSIWVDSENTYERIVKFVGRFQPALVRRVKLYTRPAPIHDSFGISKELTKALRPKVWLKSGGYLVINQTEALVAIDVNTGRYVGKSDRLEDTVLKTNLEAAEEIVRQLRLRDLGGIIVIDFIDMEDRKNRKKVHQLLQDALRKTRSPSRLLPFNDFGLVVITRKAARQSLERALCVACPACSGAGTVKSSSTVLSEIFSAAGRIAAGNNKKGPRRAKQLTLRVHPGVAKSLKRRSSSHLEELEETARASVLVRGDSSMHPEHFTLA